MAARRALCAAVTGWVYLFISDYLVKHKVSGFEKLEELEYSLIHEL